ncbi:MAG: XylR family transcriptional regulator [Chthoniobacteraceae bacterium]|nr:XylR family transcriptional regulator [Chthoniobacteraceae bacterium]
MPPLRSTRFHVALLLETSREVGRGLLRGVRRYARLHGPWGLHVMPGDLVQTVPTMRAWGGTGIIARIPTARIARAILKTGLPVIAGPLSARQLAPSNPLSKLSEIRANGEAVGSMAAGHLMERGLRHFAFVGVPRQTNWVERRQEAFCKRLAEAGYACAVYPAPPAAERDWGREQRRLARWLRGQPKPLGVMAALDARGRQVIEACMESGLRVPDEVAVIGVDNDELLCELCDPPLSSIALNAEKAGYEAAELLDRMMRGEKVTPRRISIEPTHVVARQSTEIAATGDAKIADALRFIRHEANRPLSVTDVAAHIGLSRRSLELRFRRALGHTVLTEIRRVQLERVRAFLIETDLTIGQIAAQCGFANGNYLGKIFRRECGETPQRFRLRQA